MIRRSGELLVTAVNEMRQELTSAIEQAMAKFEAETGLTPAGIDVRLESTLTYGDRVPRRVLCGVRIDIGEL